LNNQEYGPGIAAMVIWFERTSRTTTNPAVRRQLLNTAQELQLRLHDDEFNLGIRRERLREPGALEMDDEAVIAFLHKLVAELPKNTPSAKHAHALLALFRTFGAIGTNPMEKA
jgi:hypothetical protein